MLARIVITILIACCGIAPRAFCAEAAGEPALITAARAGDLATLQALLATYDNAQFRVLATSRR